MEHKHLLTYEELIMSFPCYRNEMYYHICSPEEISIQLKIHNGYSGKFEREIFDRFPITSNATDEKSILCQFLIDFLCTPGAFYGYPCYIESNLFSYDEFEELKKRSNEIIRERKEKIRNEGKDNPLIQYCESKGLQPEPEGLPNNWQANCPSGGQHHIMISTASNQWGCGYCKKKGGLEELKEFVNPTDLNLYERLKKKGYSTDKIGMGFIMQAPSAKRQTPDSKDNKES